MQTNNPMVGNYYIDVHVNEKQKLNIWRYDKDKKLHRTSVLLEFFIIKKQDTSFSNHVFFSLSKFLMVASKLVCT